MQSAKVREPIISVLGHVDHGKCIHPDTLIPLVDGRTISAKRLFEEYEGNKIREVEDGIVTEVNGDLMLFSLNGNLKLTPRKVSHLWKLRSPSRLIQIRTRDGKKLRTTKEHPFLVLTRDAKLIYKRSDEVKAGDFLVIPSELKSGKDDIGCVEVSTVGKIKSDVDHVYDFSIPETQNFVADGFIVHNTTLLDWIRGSVIASREAGGITQHIGATDVPFETIKNICGPLLDALELKTEMRGLLFIDTPGHEAFTNLRKRGGSVADLAILVVDINEGLMPQSIEAIQILKQYKVPFVIAANKVDLITGWNSNNDLNSQQEHVRKEFYDKFYSLVGKLSEHGFESDLFSQISDFSRQIAIVPISAKHGKGIPELLMVLMGLAQRYLAGKLTIDPNKPAKGTILEVREEKGLGTTIDVIVYEGVIRKNDPIVVGAKEPILTKVKALLRPKPLDEIRDPREKFLQAEEIYAAAGVKIAAPGLENALAGSPVYVGGDELLDKVREEIQDVEIEKDILGIIIKADTIGSLEALIKMLQENEIPIKKGTIGKVSNTDVIEASAVKHENRFLGVILAFNSRVLEQAEQIARDNEVKIFQNNVIYKLLEDYQLWVKEERDRDKKDLAGKVVTPAKLKLLPKCVFRQSKPAIVGVEILAGELSPGCRLMKEDGRVVGRVKEIQNKGETIKSAKSGEQVAIAIESVMMGRQLCEGDTVYPFMSNEDIEKIDKDSLSEEEKEVLREILKIKKGRVQNA